MLAFPRSARLLTASDFRRVFNRPSKSVDNCFVVLGRNSGDAPARLGLAIAKKRVKRAVDRNRLKRIIRESFRQHQDMLKGLDLVVMAQVDSPAKDNSQLFSALEKHWQQQVERRDQARTSRPAT